MEKCYYKILGVKEDAAEAEIKKAWRKKALELHPDKNPGRAEEAHLEFQKAHHAYVILSDVNERAHYDLNRDKILKQNGREETKKWAKTCTTTQRILDYMSDKLYNNVKNGKCNFYTVYGEIFNRIEMEEIYSARTDLESVFNEKFDGGLTFQKTNFGDENTPGSELVTFYAKFINFQSVKSFSWCDKYYGNEAMHLRHERRYITQDKLKSRAMQRMQFSEAVRELAKFVKARDARYIAYAKKVEAMNAKIRKERLELNLQKKKKNLKNDNSSSNDTVKATNFGEEAEWTKVDYSKLDMEMVELSIEKDMEELYCSACNKSYRSQKSYENHERSKKHLSNLKTLQERLINDEKLLQKYKLNNTDTTTSDSEVFFDCSDLK